jgi:hypothetical protein
MLSSEAKFQYWRKIHTTSSPMSRSCWEFQHSYKFQHFNHRDPRKCITYGSPINDVAQFNTIYDHLLSLKTPLWSQYLLSQNPWSPSLNTMTHLYGRPLITIVVNLKWMWEIRFVPLFSSLFNILLTKESRQKS